MVGSLFSSWEAAADRDTPERAMPAGIAINSVSRDTLFMAWVARADPGTMF